MNYLLTGRKFQFKTEKNQLIEKLVGKDNQLSVSVYSGFEDVDIDEVIDDCNMIPFYQIIRSLF